MGIFQKSVINNHLLQLDKEQVDKAFEKFNENYSPAKISEIKQLKEKNILQPIKQKLTICKLK